MSLENLATMKNESTGNEFKVIGRANPFRIGLRVWLGDSYHGTSVRFRVRLEASQDDIIAVDGESATVGQFAGKRYPNVIFTGGSPAHASIWGQVFLPAKIQEGIGEYAIDQQVGKIILNAISAEFADVGFFVTAEELSDYIAELLDAQVQATAMDPEKPLLLAFNYKEVFFKHGEVVETEPVLEELTFEPKPAGNASDEPNEGTDTLTLQ